jgi:hypothetical protein
VTGCNRFPTPKLWESHWLGCSLGSKINYTLPEGRGTIPAQDESLKSEISNPKKRKHPDSSESPGARLNSPPPKSVHDHTNRFGSKRKWPGRAIQTMTLVIPIWLRL